MTDAELNPHSVSKTVEAASHGRVRSVQDVVDFDSTTANPMVGEEPEG